MRSESPGSGPASRGLPPEEPHLYDDVLARLAREERGEGWLAYCERRGIFQWPVTQWIDALSRTLIPLGAKRPLEVGAGRGILGRSLRERGIPIFLTDPNGRGDVSPLTVDEALAEYRADLVLSCWLPFDLGAEQIIFQDEEVRWYMAIVQTGPGFAGSETLWDHPGWRPHRMENADRWSISRADYLTEVDRGEHIRRGAAFLFERTKNLK